MSGAILYGAVAALAGSVAWYVLVMVTDTKFGIAAVGVGWLTGKGVVLGSGNKRGPALQLAAGVLALVALAGGEYFILNHLVRKTFEDFRGWLTLEQFVRLYGQLATGGRVLWDIAFSLIALSVSVALPRPVKLVPKPPRVS